VHMASWDHKIARLARQQIRLRNHYIDNPSISECSVPRCSEVFRWNVSYRFYDRRKLVKTRRLEYCTYHAKMFVKRYCLDPPEWVSK